MNMIIWTGAGIVVPFIWLATLVLVCLSANSIPFLKHLGTWLFSIQHLIAGGLCFWFSMALKKQKARVVIDKETKQEITLKPSHTLFFIPVLYWSYIFFGLAAVLAILSAVKG